MPEDTKPTSEASTPSANGPQIDALPCGKSAQGTLAELSEMDRRRFLGLAAGPCTACAAAMCIPVLRALPLSAETNSGVEARFYSRLGSKAVQCGLCPRQCTVADGQRGYCRVRENRGGRYYSLAHSWICAAHIDPIEKKPFFHFLPGTVAFSVATGGCNVNCKFCQNWEISQARLDELQRQYAAPADLAAAAKRNSCPTMAYTYSEPIIATEYYLDAAEAGHRAGIRSVFVSNGFIRREPLLQLCERMDAIKIDLKAFTEKYYREVVNAELRPVLDTMLTIRKQGRWLEIVYLTVPTLNDSDADLKAMAKWVKAELGRDVPIHFSRFYPLYRLRNLPPTPLETLERAKAIADAEGLHYVYLGNVPGHPSESTYCPKCRRPVVERTGFMVRRVELNKGQCSCGQAIAGVWT